MDTQRRERERERERERYSDKETQKVNRKTGEEKVNESREGKKQKQRHVGTDIERETERYPHKPKV